MKEEFSIPRAVHMEDCEGWWLSSGHTSVVERVLLLVIWKVAMFDIKLPKSPLPQFSSLENLKFGRTIKISFHDLFLTLTLLYCTCFVYLLPLPSPIVHLLYMRLEPCSGVGPIPLLMLIMSNTFAAVPRMSNTLIN